MVHLVLDPIAFVAATSVLTSLPYRPRSPLLGLSSRHGAASLHPALGQASTRRVPNLAPRSATSVSRAREAASDGANVADHGFARGRLMRHAHDEIHVRGADHDDVRACVHPEMQYSTT